MTPEELLALAIEMRAAQRAYYAAPSGSYEKTGFLHRSLELEKRFDRAAAEHAEPVRQGRLF